MPADRVPAKVRESHARSLKTKHRKGGYPNEGLKAFVRRLNDDESRIQREDWLFNKKANTANPPQKIGRTNRIKKSGGK